MTSRKPCINVPTAFYSGKEQSPLHFGLSAEGYDLNTILEGYDHLMWAVKMKNNRKVWVRQNPNQLRMVHEEPVVPEIGDEKTDIRESMQDMRGPQGRQGQCQQDDEDNEAKQPVIANDDIVCNDPIVAPKEEVEVVVPKKPEVPKAVVEKKKMTDYNQFLTYRLYELKKDNKSNTNKELFNTAIAEWKELKKNPGDMKKVMMDVYEFYKTYEKPETRSRKK
jgi:hypothetical protein